MEKHKLPFNRKRGEWAIVASEIQQKYIIVLIFFIFTKYWVLVSKTIIIHVIYNWKLKSCFKNVCHQVPAVTELYSH